MAYNDLLIPINDYHNDLQREIDDADWLGDFATADAMREDIQHVKHMIDNGEMYYPLW
jgi:hypothetical protein